MYRPIVLTWGKCSLALEEEKVASEKRKCGINVTGNNKYWFNDG